VNDWRFGWIADKASRGEEISSYFTNNLTQEYCGSWTRVPRD
jgi:hypothetical protein